MSGSLTSLTATTSNGAARSSAARRNMRPIRPNPLIATRSRAAVSERSTAAAHGEQVVQEDELREGHRLLPVAVLEHPEHRGEVLGNVEAAPDGLLDVGRESLVAVGVDVERVDGLAVVVTDELQVDGRRERRR